MAPSEMAREAGHKSLAEVSRVLGVSEQTLINWHKNRPAVFKVLLIGLKKQNRRKVMSWKDEAIKKLRAAGYSVIDRKNGEVSAEKGDIEVNFFDSCPGEFEVIRGDSEYLGDKLTLGQVLVI